MPIFRLHERMDFPPAELAEPEGILAVGGDLSPERLLLAYTSGIFPWYSEGEPILWWSPDPRFVMFPEELHLPASLRRLLRRDPFRFTCDREFECVIASCAEPRPAQAGTWITGDMQEAYVRLHTLGYAHSVEAWAGEELAGGLYGVSLGSCFFGESMFSRRSNASKAALCFLVEALRRHAFTLIDCQVHTAHLEILGARFIPRTDYLSRLHAGLLRPTMRGNWGELFGKKKKIDML